MSANPSPTGWDLAVGSFPALLDLETAVRLAGRLHNGDLGRPYVEWRRRLQDLAGDSPYYDDCHRHLLDIWEGAA
ncbi:MAG TPA: hypothetical protein VGX78_12685 [Pirellulales bacterium]|jgi:hypothetical protein|nr:hypothetical protein [Pirellulales bacterium]